MCNRCGDSNTYSKGLCRPCYSKYRYTYVKLVCQSKKLTPSQKEWIAEFEQGLPEDLKALYIESEATIDDYNRALRKTEMEFLKRCY